VAKKKTKKKKAKPTLATVARKCRKDPEFFRALLSDYKGALKDANISLSKPQTQKLGRMVRTAGADTRAFLKKTGKGALLKAPWQGEVWSSPEWPMKWEAIKFKGLNKPITIRFDKYFGGPGKPF